MAPVGDPPVTRPPPASPGAAPRRSPAASGRATRRPVAHLRAVDPVLGGVIDRVGRFGLRPRVEGSHFDAIARAIVYQQLSTKAADTIYRRLQALFGDRAPTPAELLAADDGALRSAGVSRQKVGYLRDLADRAHRGALPLESLDDLDDGAVVAALTAVKGVGVWTAQMFLLFRLGRPDVLPTTDLGIQTAIQRAFGLADRPGPLEVARIGAAWSPHSSAAAWYLWRSLDGGAWDP